MSKKKKFKVAIEERLVSVLYVEAETEEKAIDKAFDQFHADGDIRQEIDGYMASVAEPDGEFIDWTEVK